MVRYNNTLKIQYIIDNYIVFHMATIVPASLS